VRASILPSKMYLPGSSRLCVEIEIAIETSARPRSALSEPEVCITTFSLRTHSRLCRKSLGHLLEVYGMDALYRPFRSGFV